MTMTLTDSASDDKLVYKGIEFVPSPALPAPDHCKGCVFDLKASGGYCALVDDSNYNLGTHCAPVARKDGRSIVWVRPWVKADEDKAPEPTAPEAPAPLPTVQQLFDKCEIVGMRDANGEEHIATDFETIDRYGLNMLRVKFHHREFVIPMVAQVKERLKGGYFVVDGYLSATESRKIELGFFTTLPVEV